jgi:hypothetical protein
VPYGNGDYRISHMYAEYVISMGRECMDNRDVFEVKMNHFYMKKNWEEGGGVWREWYV